MKTKTEQIDDGGPAFPIVASTGDPRDGVYCRDGISIRDYFAAKALCGHIGGRLESLEGYNPNEVARLCYVFADAMLKERLK